MTCDSREFFKLYFHELEKRSIPFVILHSYQKMPDEISSDIDYAVPSSDLPKLGTIQVEIARKHGWALVQTLQHGVFAYYAVLANMENPAETLKLDACSNYARICRLLVPESILLGNRSACRGFYIPAPAAEFIYIVAKMFDAKNKSPANYIPRLKELWSQDPANAQKYFAGLFGETGRTLEKWFECSPDEWRRLGKIMFERNGFGPALMFREGVRVVKRVFQPTGVYIAVLGSDGSGKSTLLKNLLGLLEPCYRSAQTVHFRPTILQKRTRDDAAAIATPHGRPPRSALTSWLRVLYYFADNWAGWFFKIIPAKICSTLLIFDRNFDDMLVDERRYRLSKTSFVVRILRKLLPGADRTFVLTAPAAIIHERKPELALEVLKQQQTTLRELTARNRRYILVSAEQPAETVARDVAREVLKFMAAREERRN
jgi:thymidylate kinase